jgi:hypothetical protein
MLAGLAEHDGRLGARRKQERPDALRAQLPPQSDDLVPKVLPASASEPR